MGVFWWRNMKYEFPVGFEACEGGLFPVPWWYFKPGLKFQALMQPHFNNLLLLWEQPKIPVTLLDSGGGLFSPIFSLQISSNIAN